MSDSRQPHKPSTDAGRWNGLDAFVQRHERAIILVLCVIAAVRVFVFSAALPPFNNVDEQQHFDTVYRYAQGSVPTDLPAYGERSARIFAIYGTFEYLRAPEAFPRGFPRPLWTLPTNVPEIDRVRDMMTQRWMAGHNTEATQPPVYYAVAGAWYRLGKLFGIDGGYELYWIRFLNVPLFALLVWCAYVLVGSAYPGKWVLRVGVPLMLAFLPQDVFYSANNDVMSPLLFCISFYCLLRIYREGLGSYWFCLLTGLAVAATVLVKFTNLSLLLVFGIVVAIAISRLRAAGKLKGDLPKLAVLFLACVAPIALWLARNYLVLHDLTGNAAKTRYLGWSPKPLGAIWDHPIFSPSGALVFFRDLTAKFWRGEINWHGAPMVVPSVDAFFCVSTLVLLLVAVVSAWVRRGENANGETFADGMSALVMAASAAILISISVAFDFGRCWYPSSAYPYVTSGRLVLGVLAPFLVLYVSGLNSALARLKLTYSRFGALLVIAALMISYEVAVMLPVFWSQYNWFHMIAFAR